MIKEKTEKMLIEKYSDANEFDTGIFKKIRARIKIAKL